MSGEEERAICAALHDLAARLAVARRQTRDGGAPDISGLAAAIEAALARAAALRPEPEERRAAIMNLAQECEALASALDAEKAETSRVLAALRRQARAGAAYGGRRENER